MKCEDIESILPAYILGDLDGEDLSDCMSHLESCERCRCSLEQYNALINNIAHESDMMVSVSESASLAQALDGIQVRRPVINETIKRPWYELLGFGLASVVVLVLIITVLGLNAAGRLNPVSWNPLMTIPVLAVIIFVTSFLPIAINARRGSLTM